MSQPIEAGTYFMQGNEACAEGAIAAGCRYFAFYPITPAGEIAERMAERLPRLGGIYIQMEDEIAALGSVIGASWTGVKAMTATSGPGFSLMQEHIGHAVMTETPCVIVDVQRAGPSTGIPPVPMQGDIYQARRGSHGEYEIIVLAPYSAQEMFDLTIEAFNLSEEYRTPVILLPDEIVGHMREEVTIPSFSSLKLVERKKPTVPPEEFKPFLDESVAPMPSFGTGYHVHVTGSSHDERGFRNVRDPEAIDKVVRRLCAKIRKNIDKITKVETKYMDDADVALLSYGSSARAALYVAKEARAKGFKVGFIRLITLWPFADAAVREVAQQVRKILVFEDNLGQIVNEVQRAVAGSVEVELISPEVIGTLHRPDYALNRVLQGVR